MCRLRIHCYVIDLPRNTKRRVGKFNSYMNLCGKHPAKVGSHYLLLMWVVHLRNFIFIFINLCGSHYLLQLKLSVLT